MKQKSIWLGILLLLLGSFPGQSQKLAFEKTYEITGKARRGYLDEVIYDAPTKTTKLSFVTRETTNFSGNKSKVKYQDYYFDKEFNFIKMDEKVDEYRNKKYQRHGDSYEVEGVSMQNNLTGTFVLRRKLISYKWDWFFGGYRKKIKLSEKVKPKDDSGNKYTLIRKFENDETGEVIAMVKAKGKGADPNEFVFLKVTPKLDFEITDKIRFDVPQALADSYLIANMSSDEEDDGDLAEEEASEDDSPDADEDQGNISTNDAGFMFATSFMGKKGNADSHDYTFLRVSSQGKIEERVAIKTAASIWSINQCITTGESIYFFGPANDGKFFDQVLAAGQDTEGMKWKNFQIAKITKGKVDYITLTDLDEFEAKLMAPPSQKKSPSYRGKKFHFTGANLLDDGSLMISGQNYTMTKKAPKAPKTKSYTDVMMFYFDNAGKLKAQYGVRREENNKYAKLAPTMQKITTGKNNVYWSIMEMDGIAEEKEGKVRVVKALIYPSVTKIEPATGKISDFVQFGTVNNKPAYYLHNRSPILPMSEENAMVYLGASKSGKTLWFGKVMLD
jgi:hypothetical protein